MRIIDAKDTLGGSPPARAAAGSGSRCEQVAIIASELPADAIAWDLPPVSPWPSASPVVALAIEAIPAIEDIIAARLTERMALTIVDLVDELPSVRAVLSASMTRAYEQQLVIDRLHQQIVQMREADRAKERAA